MANLSNKNGVYIARFRFQGKEYKKSLKTAERKDADAAMHRVEDALHRLAINLIAIPDGVDPGDFIISGGTLTAPVRRQPRTVPALGAVIREYIENLGHLAESNQATVRLPELKQILLKWRDRRRTGQRVVCDVSPGCSI